jgi:hypothetical protein
MLTGIGNIANPRKLGATVKKLLLKLLVGSVVARVFAGVLLVPYPVLDMPCGESGDNRVASRRCGLKSLVGGSTTSAQNSWADVKSKSTY